MISLKIPLPTLPFIGLALTSLIVYLCAPSHYVWGFDLYCGIHYVVSLFLFFFFLKKKNYFDFDTIFLISYFFVFFVYSIFLYPISETYFFMFAYSFNSNVISESTALALLGSQMYMLGAVWFHFKKRLKIESCNAIKQIYLPTNVIHYITIVLFSLFIAVGGYSFFVAVYKEGRSVDEVSIIGYIFALFMAFYMISITVEFNKLKILDSVIFQYKKVNHLFLFFILLSSIILLSTGTRTSVLQFLLSLLGLYSLLYRPINFKFFVFLFLGGVCVMSFVVITRSERGAFQIDSFVDLFMDLIINNRNTFTAVEYVNHNGYSYGVSMLAYIFKVIPFMQGLVCSVFNLDPNNLRSAMILTIDTLGENATFGLGTNIIADLYLAFGFPGVIVFMTYLGYIVHKTEWMARLGNIYYLSMYAVLISLSVYMVRSEFFYGLSLLVWTLGAVNIIRHYTFKNTIRE